MARDSFEKGTSTHCDYCGHDLSTGALLDRHQGTHAAIDPQATRMRHMPEKKFKQHSDDCVCKACLFAMMTNKEQKRAHWESLNRGERAA